MKPLMKWLQRPPSGFLAVVALVALLFGFAILQRSLAYLQVASWAPFPLLPVQTSSVPTGIVSDASPQPTWIREPSAISDATPSTLTAKPIKVEVGAGLPSDIAQALAAGADGSGIPYRLAEDQEADVRIDTQREPDGILLAFRVYVPVARFATLRQGVTTEELQAIWSGQAATPLLVAEDALASLRGLWGEPAAGSAVTMINAEALPDRLWAEPEALGVVPFHRLEPRLKALSLDGYLPTDKALALADDGAPSDYPLTMRVFAHGSAEAVEQVRAALSERVILADRDASRLTVLIMTGVTALTRTTAAKMEAYRDHAYPAHKIASVLAAADITHVSNEVPFVAGCPVNADPDNLVFCSKPEYMATLQEIGTDIVGLTGNHMNDFGHEALIASLDYYKEQGIRTYAAGRNAAEALQPLLVDDHGNRLAFLGANQFGPASNWAGEDTPGSARYDFATMAAQIKAARQDERADVVLVELQWEESYEALPLPDQVEAFTALSAAGADIVTGVQSHVPQAVAFHNGHMILYGLGNLFFDQMFSLQTRQGLVARHVFHWGRHISTDLLVTVIEDFAQPRWATEPERQEVLTRVFRASGW